MFEPPGRLEFVVTAGPARPTGTFELTENGEASTKVRFALDLIPTGLTKLMTPMITRTIHSEVVQLDALKEILERS